jgi:hypothetical protein
MTYAVVAIILGLAELFFGRFLFWLFGAIGGFIVGWFLIPEIYPSVTGGLRILAGVGIGVVFGVLAIVYLRLVVAVAGFFVFSGAAVLVGRDAGATLADGSASYWFVYGVSGFVAALLLLALTDWALILLTSLAGAGAVARGAFHLVNGRPGWPQWVLAAVLAIIGIVFQAWRYKVGSGSSGTPRQRQTGGSHHKRPSHLSEGRTRTHSIVR